MEQKIAAKSKAGRSSIAYNAALFMINDSFKKGKAFAKAFERKYALSGYEVLGALALQKYSRKEIVKRYISAHDLLSIVEVGSLAWVISKSLNDYNDQEKLEIEAFFIKYEEYFDAQINADDLLPADDRYSWMAGTNRTGCLVEVQALYARILDVLNVLTRDSMYPFKLKRFKRAVRNKLDGAYILDRTDSFQFRPSVFLAAFIAPEIFTKKEWEDTFDSFLKDKNLWLSWGGIATLSKSDVAFDPMKEGSYFFINNITAIVLSSLDQAKYQEFIEKIFEASSKNIVWQDHVGRPCEVFVSGQNRLINKGHYSLSLSTYIYLFRSLTVKRALKKQTSA